MAIQSPSLTPTKSVISKIGRTKRQQHQHSPFVFRLFLIHSTSRRTLVKHDIPAHLNNPRGRTIRDLTQLPDAMLDKICHSKSCPAPGICQQSNVVHVATCILCGEFYVGITTWKLHDPAREHGLSASKRNNSTALGDHYREHQNEKKQ